MRNKKGKSLRKLSWVVGTRVAGAVLLVVALLSVNGCTPEINNDSKANTDGEMMFNLLANPIAPKSIPQPIYLAINPVTGNVDLSQADIPLPKGLTWKRELPCTELLNGTCTEMQSADCANLTAEQQKILTIASCDVYKYLLSIDGFPTAAPITMQSSLQIDTTKEKVKIANDGTENVLVFCSDRTYPNDVTKLNIYNTSDFQIDSKQSASVANAWDLTLTINTAFGINKDCFVAVRGYENGIKSQDGAKPFMASQTFFLLKEKDSLTCGLTKGNEGIDACQAMPPALIPTTCKYYPMVAGAPGNEGKSQIYISGLMCVLEYLRTTEFGRVFAGIDLWSGSKTMSDEAAIAFEFPTHSTPTIEYIPGKIEPIFNSTNNTISIHVNGTITNSQLQRAYTPSSGNPVTGTVFLINATAILGGGTVFPTYDVTFNSTTHQIVISNVTPALNSATTYLVFISKGIDANGKPIIKNMIPFMSTIVGLTKGPLYDENSHKILVTPLSGITDTTTAYLSECSRYDLVNNVLPILEAVYHTESKLGLTSSNILYVTQAGMPHFIYCSELNPTP